MEPKGSPYKRFVLKVTGESLCKAKGFGIDVDAVKKLAEHIAPLVAAKKEVAVVVGGGNIIRGDNLAGMGIGRTTADHMGMLGTVINGLVLQNVLEDMGVETRVMSAIEVVDVCEPYILRRALRHLEKGRCVILVGGTGHPYFTTDTTAALRAAELGAEILFKGTKVDGVYSADPNKDPNAKKFESLTYMDVLNQGLKVMDTTAISLCMDNSMLIRVFNLSTEGALEKAVAGEHVGTLIMPDNQQ